MNMAPSSPNTNTNPTTTATTSATPNTSTATTRTTTAGTTPSATPCKRKRWWQHSIVKRIDSFIKSDIESVQQVKPEQANIALFPRCEFETGRVLDTGGVSVVPEVTGFHLDPAFYT
jgi:hypothetical protein